MISKIKNRFCVLKSTALLTAVTAIVSVFFLAGCKELTRSIIVTAQVGEETYRFWVIDPEQVKQAYNVLHETVSLHPHGKIVRSPSKVNAPYAWHIDPRTAGFAEMSIELCDGLPSYVDGETWSGDYFCPWTAKIVGIEKYPFAETFDSREEMKAEFENIFK